MTQNLSDEQNDNIFFCTIHHNGSRSGSHIQSNMLVWRGTSACVHLLHREISHHAIDKLGADIVFPIVTQR